MPWDDEMTDARLSTRHPEGESILWESRPSVQTLSLRLGIAGLFVVAGLLVLLKPLGAIAGFEPSIGQRILPGLASIGFGIVLGAAFWRQRPRNVRYQLTDRQLRIFLGDRLVRRMVRGEVRMLACRGGLTGGASIGWGTTLGFTGNPAGLSQSGTRLFGLPDAEKVLARLANWTVGDESRSVSAAAAFAADPGRQGREAREPRHQVRLRVADLGCLPGRIPGYRDALRRLGSQDPRNGS